MKIRLCTHVCNATVSQTIVNTAKDESDFTMQTEQNKNHLLENALGVVQELGVEAHQQKFWLFENLGKI